MESVMQAIIARRHKITNAFGRKQRELVEALVVEQILKWKFKQPLEGAWMWESLANLDLSID